MFAVNFNLLKHDSKLIDTFLHPLWMYEILSFEKKFTHFLKNRRAQGTAVVTQLVPLVSF